MKKLFTKTFGCQMNFADSDEMGQHLTKRGFESIASPDSADAILVNTCTVRDLAEHKASSYLGRLEDWKKSSPNKLLILTGCAAERAKKEFKHRFPFIDLIVGAKDIDKFADHLDTWMNKNGIQEEELLPSLAASKPSALTSTAVTQFVTIMRGCNYSCTYCIVPSVRGRESYRPVNDILDEAAQRVKNGAKEIFLLGQTVNSYRPSNPPVLGYDFSNLLTDTNNIEGLKRIRFMSPHPYYVSPQFIDSMANNDHVCKHLHLPVQSGSDPVLSRMKRNYTRNSYLTAIKKLRNAMPNLSLTTDLIVGFPGESDYDFDQTLNLVDEADFDSAYCFKYSPRPSTAAAEMNDDVPDGLKDERVNRLLEKIDAIGAAKARRYLGTTQTVLVEEITSDGKPRGKTDAAWRVRLEEGQAEVGDLVSVRITNTHCRELHGSPLQLQKTA